ncbi:uncharacterized protein LOC116306811 [Actinia tenebrosa]|uniref:Uncharacterized protein LOC116306811 n=1 Tax=Actinia tenebrosa TaxID=6105 RepID=A0A6P8J433_ACTTE|nr:uncharacterized protein LOC116306811 [Actinia tenebrosa]
MAEENKTTTPCRVILIPVDASSHSEAAFDWYLSNIRHDNDHVIIGHCHEIHQPVMPHAMDTDEWAKTVGVHEEKLKALEEKYSKKAQTAKLSAKILIKGGKPGEAICELAKEEHAQIIVMGSRGLGALRRTFLGSVSDYVLHHAHIPVIIFPKK